MKTTARRNLFWGSKSDTLTELIETELLYCDHRESYIRNFSSFFEIFSSQAS